MITKKELIKFLEDDNKQKTVLINELIKIIENLSIEICELKEELRNKDEGECGEWVVITKENCEEITNQLNKELSIDANAQNIIKGIDNIIKGDNNE